MAGPGMLLLISWHTLNALKRLWIDTSNMNWIKHLIPVALLVTIGLSALTIGKLQKVYYSYEFSNHDQTVAGEITFVTPHEFPFFYYNRYASVRYKFNNKYFTQDISNKKQKLILGDSIKLRLSTKNPLIIEAVDN